MKNLKLTVFALGVALTLPTLATEQAATEQAAETEATLPTPYTAEQIRDAYVLGLRVVTRFTTPNGIMTSVSNITEWSAEGMVLNDQTLDAEGVPAGKARRIEATWSELRDHAKFPVTRAKRERVERETPLGKFEGWLYRVHGEDGSQSEFFFADAWPGPPIVFSQSRDGQRLLLAEMIERQVVEK